MINCTECKNNGYCPLWKSEKIDVRIRAERGYPINYCLQMVVTISKGEYIAKHCEKFQKMI